MYYTLLMNVLTIDLPNLHTIIFDNGLAALLGSDNSKDKEEINGHSSYRNTLTMKSIMNE